MSSESAPPAAAGKPRLAERKLLLVGGAATLALLLTAGAIVWALFPVPADPAATRGRAAKAQATAASAASLQAAKEREPATTAAAADTNSASVRVDTGAAPPAITEPRAEAASAAEASEVEAPLDRLQRRLGQVLGARAQVGVQGGEWRLLTRASTGAAAAVQPAPGPRLPAETARAPVANSASPHWGYDGRGGPQAWGRLRAEFATCASGRRQSPIDIRDGLALDLEPVRFDYRPGPFAVIDTGHTIQVNVPTGSAIELDGRRYELLQFHFHRPSEERVNGRQFDMDVHLVHRDAEGRLAVVAVLLERGAAQPLLQTVWNHLPLEKGEEAAARASIDLNDLLPADRRYYTYMGSLTTPPCSEGVRWVVLQQPATVSGAQIDIFARLYPMNARPIQQAAGRLIKQSN